MIELDIVGDAGSLRQQRMAQVQRGEAGFVLHQLGKRMIGILVAVGGQGIQRFEFRPGCEPRSQ